MKRLVSFFLLLIPAITALSQTGNEWIDYTRDYYKIPVAREGLYRVSRQALIQAGFPAQADPRTIRLFHRGVEQAIRIEGENDGVFDASDFIEFYGLANDGTLDQILYENPEEQPHLFYNLYSDTTAYFLTASPGQGKRMSVYAGSASSIQSYHHSEKLLVLKDQYAAGADYGNVRKTTFDAGEGWTGVQILHSQERTYSVAGIGAPATAAGKPYLEVLLTGRGPMSHEVELSSASRALASVTFQGYGSYLHAQELEWSDIDASGAFSLKVRVTGAGGADRISVGYIRLRYARQNVFNADETIMFVEEPMAATALDFAAFPPGIRCFDVTDPEAVKVLPVSPRVEVPALSDGRSRKILATTLVHDPAQVRRVVFREVSPSLHNYVMITHPLLRRPAQGYTDPVKAYAEYRAQPAGGGFDTLIMNIGDLYDQFNYGETSPAAIFRFLKFLSQERLPEYLFLIGKGLDVNYGYNRNPGAFAQYKDLVPTAGYPASDLVYSLGLDGNPLAPGIATGRLTANGPAEVAAYLNKVIEREGLPFGALWQKKILHLSGGVEEHEPALFRELMRDFQAVAEDHYLGGKVQAVAKSATGVKLVNIAEEVNNGLGMVTFFGHSAPNTLDFDIGLVTDPVMGYNNSGKYPLLLMNGCDAGSFFLNTNILGENWTKAADKGAIGFIAHSSYGLVTGLRRYTSLFYDVAFGDSVFIKRSVGKVQKEVARRYLANHGNAPLSTSQAQQMVLLGDPAVKIFGAGKPDYSIVEEELSVSRLTDEPLTALSDSFLIHVPVRNVGISRQESIRVEVTRQYNGNVVHYDSIFPAVMFSDTLAIVIRNSDNAGFGVNRFTIRIDADDVVDELDEGNNTADFEYFIPLNGTRNLYPYDFSIVSDTEVTLSFQYTDLLSEGRSYVLELDTTDTFNSGYKQHVVLSGDVLVRHQVTLPDTDTLAYYWRTRIADPLENESTSWAVSTFTYIGGGDEGWGQVHFPQLVRNEGIDLVADPEVRRLRFQETVSEIALRTFATAAGKPQDSVSLKINGVEFNLAHEGTGCRNNTLNLVAFDRRSTQPYAGVYFKWYELMFEYGGRRLICGREPFVINSFRPEELVTNNADDLIQYVDNIPTGDSVVLFNIGNAGYSTWPQAARDKLAEFGISADQITDLQDGDAVVIMGRKRSPPGSARLHRGTSASEPLEIQGTIAGRSTSGSLTSTIVGPARQWDHMVVKVSEQEPSDTYSFTVIGLTPGNGVDTLRIVEPGFADLSDIDAAVYPRLKIVMNAADETALTAVQLDKWLVAYEPEPEGVIFFDGPYGQSTLYEGQAFSAAFGFVNVSDKPFTDSLLVRYEFLNALNRGGGPASMKITGPAPGDTTLFTLQFPTAGKGGLNDVDVFVNAALLPEFNYDNNVLVVREQVNVIADQSRPVIDITFDGRHLEDEDFVSVSPVVRIQLWDENAFMPKQDTLGVRLFLSSPCSDGDCSLERIFFSRPDVTWHPSTASSPYEVVFHPQSLADGRYMFRVEAADAAGNTSGVEPYEIHFRVAQEESFLLAAPYPNPFQTEVTFEVVVTGEESPSNQYVLQITDLQGRKVVELIADVSGMLIGTNRIRWNGLDAEGNRLPAGIFIYRILIRDGRSQHEYVGRIALSP